MDEKYTHRLNSLKSAITGYQRALNLAANQLKGTIDDMLSQQTPAITLGIDPTKKLTKEVKDSYRKDVKFLEMAREACSDENLKNVLGAYMGEVNKLLKGSVSVDGSHKKKLSDVEKQKIYDNIQERVKTGDVGRVVDGKFVSMSVNIGEEYSVSPSVIMTMQSNYFRKHPVLRKKKDKMIRKIKRELKK